MKAPIIVVGMHRSGTSMVSRMLKSLGVFMGRNTGRHNEAAFFVKLNSWILKQVGADWDAPNNLTYLNENESVKNQIIKYLSFYLRTPFLISYLGIIKWLKYRRLPIAQPWGWKDPVNCLTLSIWLKLFPNAKVIFIKRHGIDVANSLKVKGESYTKKSISRFENLFAFKVYTVLFKHLFPLRRVRAFSHSLACMNLNQSLQVWNTYNDLAYESLSQIQAGNLLEIKYEDLLENQEEYTKKIASFCNLERKEKNLLSLLSEKLDVTRAYSYRQKDGLVEEAIKHKALLEIHGY